MQAIFRTYRRRRRWSGWGDFLDRRSLVLRRREVENSVRRTKPFGSSEPAKPILSDNPELQGGLDVVDSAPIVWCLAAGSLFTLMGRPSALVIEFLHPVTDHCEIIGGAHRLFLPPVASFDDLVGTGENAGRNGDADRISGSHIQN